MMNPEVETAPSPDVRELHRQEVRRWVFFPVIGGLILIVVLVLSTIFLTPRGLGTVANFLLSCFCLLPLVLCVFPLYMILMAAIYGMSWLTDFSLQRLEQVRELTVSLEKSAADTTDRLNRQAIDVSASLARLNPILDFFNRYPKSRSQGELPHVD
jgi:hypothetical protein